MSSSPHPPTPVRVTHVFYAPCVPNVPDVLTPVIVKLLQRLLIVALARLHLSEDFLGQHRLGVIDAGLHGKPTHASGRRSTHLALEGDSGQSWFLCNAPHSLHSVLIRVSILVSVTFPLRTCEVI